MRKKITFDTQFLVSTNDIFLTIVIGNANPGSSTVRLGDDVIKDGIVENFNIGNGSSLKGKKLIILTTVQDFLINSNLTSVTFVLDDGVTTKKYFLDGTVDVDKDKIDYKINIDLK